MTYSAAVDPMDASNIYAIPQPQETIFILRHYSFGSPESNPPSPWRLIRLTYWCQYQATAQGSLPSTHLEYNSSAAWKDWR
jgi:hypothetical protein